MHNHVLNDYLYCTGGSIHEPRDIFNSALSLHNSLLDCLAWLRGQCPTPSPIRILFFLCAAAAAHRPRPSRLLFHHQAPVSSPPGLSDSILSLSRSPLAVTSPSYRPQAQVIHQLPCFYRPPTDLRYSTCSVR
jgi:hypothetical protein